MLARSFDKVLIIANPISGGCQARRWLGPVRAAFENAGCNVEASLPGCVDDARRLVGAHDGRNALLVTFGGDGTFNMALNAADLSRTTLAVIPAGAGNAFASELGMSWHPVKAARQLLGGRVVRLDVGVCNGRRFAFVFGTGIDASVVKIVHARRRRGMTQWHYVPHAVYGLLRRHSWQLEVEVDGKPFASGLDQVAVGNTHTYGGPMEMTPAASPDDGLFDVMCVRRRSLSDIIALMACGVLRSLHRSRRVRYGRGSRVHVSSPLRDVPYELDGEDAGILPAEVVMLAGAANVLAPASFRSVPRALWRTVC